MTERLSDINAHIGGIHQLDAVVNAMRGIAAARVQQARSQLVAVDNYAAKIADVIGRTLNLLPPEPPDFPHRSMRPAIVLFCAEQGFAGAFSERILDSAGTDLAKSVLLLIGSRGSAVATERGVKVDWTVAMTAHSPGIPILADRIADALYTRIASGGIDQLDVIFSQWHPNHGIEIVRRRLFPFDLSTFSQSPNANVPLLNISPQMLLRGLTRDYMHAQLCQAALHAFAAENEARMEAMAAAHSQIEDQMTAMQATRRHVRQSEITAEIIELAAGETASRSESDEGDSLT